MNTNALYLNLDTISPRSTSGYFLANPYATPSAQLRTSNDTNDTNEIKLAGRGKRLGAVLIDSIILIFIFYFILLVFHFLFLASQGYELERTMEELDRFLIPDDINPFSINLLDPIVYLQIIIPVSLYFLINGYFLSKSGQTIGKMLLNIAIRDKDTLEIPPLSKIILRRYLIFDAFVSINIVLYAIVDLVDVLSIFRQDKRMIHDLIANTIVVQVPE